MNIPLVDLKAQYRALKTELDLKYFEVMENAAFIKGGELAEFEKELARFSRVKHAIGVKSGTAALFLVFRALGLEKGFRTLAPANTFFATTEMVHQAGGHVRLADVDENSLLDLDRLEVKPSTRLVIPVHMYGQMVDMKKLKEKAPNAIIVEDAAQAIGACINGVSPGELGVAATVSFFPSKVLGACGDGGAVLTNDDGLAADVYKLRDHGRGPGDKYVHRYEGYNERLDNLQAAFLRVKLGQLEAWIRARNEHARLYSELLSKVPQVRTPNVAQGAKHVFYVYVIQAEHRDRLQEFLKGKGIGTGVHYPLPIHLQPAYVGEQYKQGDFPATEAQAASILSLPMYPELTRQQIEYIAGAIREFYGKT
jgi:dTDP-4-amino-4,6-dideoxygalactose transaminase